MFNIIKVGERLIIIGGVGKLFYQDGFPISLSITELKRRGYEVSILHVADECMRNGWSGKTTYNKLVADFTDDIDRNPIDLSQLKSFCEASYEDQRSILFLYLFRDQDNAREWFQNTYIEDKARQ